MISNLDVLIGQVFEHIRSQGKLNDNTTTFMDECDMALRLNERWRFRVNLLLFANLVVTLCLLCVVVL